MCSCFSGFIQGINEATLLVYNMPIDSETFSVVSFLISRSPNPPLGYAQIKVELCTPIRRVSACMRVSTFIPTLIKHGKEKDLLPKRDYKINLI